MVEGYATTFNEVATRALITHEDKVLLVYESHLDQWWLPGGRIKPGEPMLEGLTREIEEETALAVTLGDLATFFDVIVPVRAQGCNKHIFHFVFHGTPDLVPDFIERAHIDTDPDHPGKVSKMRWFTAAEIAAMDNVYPPFLKDWPELLTPRPKAYYGTKNEDGALDHFAVENFYISARTVTVHDSKVLMVRNHNAEYWYGAGGRIEYGEALLDAAAREVQEEAGLPVTAHDVIAVDEFFSARGKIHQINLYTRCTPQHGDVPCGWSDPAGGVAEARFFDRQQLAALPRAYPLYMAELAWPATVQEKVEV